MAVSEKLFRFHDGWVLLALLGKLSLGGLLAFGLGFSEFLLVSRTSSLTLSIAGIFKVGSCGDSRRLGPDWPKQSDCARGLLETALGTFPPAVLGHLCHLPIPRALAASDQKSSPAPTSTP